MGSPRWKAMVERAAAPSAAMAIQTKMLTSRFTLVPWFVTRSWNAREFQQRIDLAENLQQFSGKAGFGGDAGLHFATNDPALDFLPVFWLHGPTFVLRPIPFFGGVPVAVVFPGEAAFLFGDPFGFGDNTGFGNDGQRRFLAFWPGIDSKAGGHRVGRNAHVELAAFPVSEEWLLELQVHLRFVGRLVLGKTNVT